MQQNLTVITTATQGAVSLSVAIKGKHVAVISTKLPHLTSCATATPPLTKKTATRNIGEVQC